MCPGCQSTKIDVAEIDMRHRPGGALMLYSCIECAARWTSRSLQDARENKDLGADGWWRGMLPDAGPIVAIPRIQTR